MTFHDRLRQVVIAFLLAVILACVFSIVARAEDGEVVVQPFDICRGLEPYGYWWFFWGCHER